MAVEEVKAERRKAMHESGSLTVTAEPVTPLFLGGALLLEDYLLQ